MFMHGYTHRPFPHLLTGVGHVSQAIRVQIKHCWRFHWSFGVCSLYHYNTHSTTLARNLRACLLKECNGLKNNNLIIIIIYIFKNPLTVIYLQLNLSKKCSSHIKAKLNWKKKSFFLRQNIMHLKTTKYAWSLMNKFLSTQKNEINNELNQMQKWS